MLTTSDKTAFIATEKEGIVTVRIAGQPVASYPGRFPAKIVSWANTWLRAVGLAHKVASFSCHTYEGHPRFTAIVKVAK